MPMTPNIIFNEDTSNWKYIISEIEVSKECSENYAKLVRNLKWEAMGNRVIDNILIVGGANLQIASMMLKDTDAFITVVDPKVFEVQELQNLFLSKETLSLVSREISPAYRLQLVPKKLKCAPQSILDREYDLIFIDVSEVYKSFFDKENFEIIQKLNSPTIMYLPHSVHFESLFKHPPRIDDIRIIYPRGNIVAFNIP